MRNNCRKTASLTARSGFTLAELLIAIFISSMVFLTLATTTSTAQAHLRTSYAKNKRSSDLLIASKLLRNKFLTATRIDSPLPYENSAVLAFASNIDPSGCSPIRADLAVEWHFFCILNSSLYHHTAPIPAGTGCPAATFWNPGTAYPATCGSPSKPGEIVTRLADNILLDPTEPTFSRKLPEQEMVKVFLLSDYPRGLKNSSRAEITARLHLRAAINPAVPLTGQ